VHGPEELALGEKIKQAAFGGANDEGLPEDIRQVGLGGRGTRSLSLSHGVLNRRRIVF
jgi:hypothetical protein